MLKYSLVIYHKQYDALIHRLGELGIFHVQATEVRADDALKQITTQIARIERAKESMQEHTSPIETKDLERHMQSNEEVLSEIESLISQWEELKLKKAGLAAEIAQILPWRNINKEYFEILQKHNLNVFCFACHKMQFNDAWKEQYMLEVVGRHRDRIFFVVLAPSHEHVQIEAEEIVLPEHEWDDLLSMQNAICNDMDKVQKQLSFMAHHYSGRLQEKLTALEEMLAARKILLSSLETSGGKILILEGFIPEPKEQQLLHLLNDHAVPYIQKKPLSDDAPPIQLKNNRFSRLFEPIGKLFSLPSYKDMDLTPFFAPFFLLFFGFCLGDAVYGLLIMLAATFFKRKKKYQVHKPLLSLVQLFGLAAMIVGTVTGTFLGVNHDGLNLGSYHSLFLDQHQLFYVAIALGISQILFAQALQAYHRITTQGFLYGLVPIGWMLVILSVIDLSVAQYMPFVSDKTVYIGLVLIVLFADPKARALKGLGKGIWSLYGITGLFGDVLSYIRLFALGVSSSILGLVINSMAYDALGLSYVGWFFFIVILVIGHSLNLGVAALGAFVHPLRLTFVEFYKNAGFEGGGKEYKPFSINHKISLKS
ncbi:V-type ATP synthase subunit I [Nitrosomonas aestuarii]|nr:V-type ATPase 116kDa subunit family protein [Nitrosomonas aestuarii]